MIPIIVALVPTVVGAAMLVGLNDSGRKGALLFGSCYHHYLDVAVHDTGCSCMDRADVRKCSRLRWERS